MSDHTRPTKCYVLDTSVIVDDPAVVARYASDPDVIVAIPIVVLEELDSLKTSRHGHNVREFTKSVEEMLFDVRDGIVTLETGARVMFPSSDQYTTIMYSDLDGSKNDNVILSIAYGLRSEHGDVTLVTNDVMLRVKCGIIGIDAMEHDRSVLTTQQRTPFDDLLGVRQFTSTPKMSKRIAASREVSTEEIEQCGVHEHIPNSFLHDTTTDAILRYDPWRGMYYRLRDWAEAENLVAWGVRPRNVEQAMALKLLLDDRVNLVTLVGKAGTGKTLLSIAAAAQKAFEEGVYDKIIITRPVVPVGRDIGFLPGDLNEKMLPWLQPIFDNIDVLFNPRDASRQMLDMWIERGMLEVGAISYIRGRSLSSAFIIIDEAQNLTQHEAKTIVTRVGEASKIVMVGDIDQIDTPYVSRSTNGLAYVARRLYQSALTGHVTLTSGERSPLASLAIEHL